MNKKKILVASCLLILQVCTVQATMSPGKKVLIVGEEGVAQRLKPCLSRSRKKKEGGPFSFAYISPTVHGSAKKGKKYSFSTGALHLEESYDAVGFLIPEEDIAKPTLREKFALLYDLLPSIVEEFRREVHGRNIYCFFEKPARDKSITEKRFCAKYLPPTLFAGDMPSSEISLMLEEIIPPLYKTGEVARQAFVNHAKATAERKDRLFASFGAIEEPLVCKSCTRQVDDDLDHAGDAEVEISHIAGSKAPVEPFVKDESPLVVAEKARETLTIEVEEETLADPLSPRTGV